MKKIVRVSLFVVMMALLVPSYNASTVYDTKSVKMGTETLEIPSQVDVDTLISEDVYDYKEPVSFDISKNETQTALVKTEDGGIASLTLEPMNVSRETDTIPSGYSTWKTNYNDGFTNIKYQFKVYNPSSGQSSITDYWGASYSTIYKIVGEDFSRNSAKTRVSYRVSIKAPARTFTNTLETKVNYSTLTTSRY